MSLEDINDLPDSPSAGQSGHRQSHAKIHSGLKSVKKRMEGIPYAELDPTGVNDSTTALNTLLSAQNVYGFKNVVLTPGTYKISGTIEIDIVKTGLFAPYGGVILNASSMGTPSTPTPAIRITASAAIPNNGAPSGVKFGGFQLIGPGKTIANSIGIEYGVVGVTEEDGRGGGQVRSVNVQDYRIESFGTGERYISAAYCLNHTNASIGRCGVGVHAPTGMFNGGERISYELSTIHGCDTAILNEGANTRFHVVNSSLDYNKRIYEGANGGLGIFSSCHLEGDMEESTIPFKISTGASLEVSNGLLVFTNSYSDALSPQAMVENLNDPVTGAAAIFRDVYMNNTRTTTDFFSVGGGNTIVQGRLVSGGVTGTFICVSETANLLLDGGMEGNPKALDKWSIVTDSTTPTDPLVGVRGNILRSVTAFRSGASSTVVQKTGTLGQAFAVACVVPIRGGAMPGFIGWLSKGAGTPTGSVSLSLRWVAIHESDAGVITIKKIAQASQSLNTTDIATVSPSTWVKFHSGRTTRRAPSWATHVAIHLDVTAMTS
jgi:hypothetical protein